MAQEPRPAPRISVNKLGEYLTATPARRKRIIHDQKFPPTFQVTRYNDAESAVLDFLLNGMDESLLDKHVAKLHRTVATTEFQSERLGNCVEAIESFREFSDSLDLDGLKLVKGQSDPPLLSVAGVSVSIRPEVQVRSGKGAKRAAVGLLKLYFSKNNLLDDQSGKYVAALARRFAEDHLAESGEADHRLVRVVDVFGQRVYAAPKSMTRAMDDITAACEEIAVRWPSMT